MNTLEQRSILFFVYKRMLSTILSSLGFVISIAMVQSGGPPADIVKGGPPADIVKGGPNTDIGKGGTPPSVGSGFGYNDDLVRTMNSKFEF